ncbi:MAG TPA: NYN domain-containing protein [Trueperaceae bacterium]|nr:NYN domain-containing protein [Trueperaceae bacterium]
MTEDRRASRDAGAAIAGVPSGRPDGPGVALFVDTQNLYYAARDGYDAAVDYRRLLELAVSGRRLLSATAYVVEREGDSGAFGFVTKLTALGYRVRRRAVRVHRADDAGRVVMEGDWDMGIAADMVRAMPHADVLVLGSGDADFTPMVELAQQAGKRVEVLAFREAAGQALMDQCDRFTHLPDVDEIFVRRG